MELIFNSIQFSVDMINGMVSLIDTLKTLKWANLHYSSADEMFTKKLNFNCNKKKIYACAEKFADQIICIFLS